MTDISIDVPYTDEDASAAAPVQSINGETGVVVLGASDVGADPAGTASGAVASHEAASNPHPGYQLTSGKDQANGYAGLSAALKIAAAQIQEVIGIADLTDVSGKTGAGSTVVMQTSPTLTTPTIDDYTNATHNHQNAAGGGGLDAAAIATGTLARARLPAQVAYRDEANSFTNTNDFSTVLRAPRKTTPVSPVTGELFVDGVDLRYRDNQGAPANQTVERQSRRGAANGYGSLDDSSQQPLSELKVMVGATDVANGARGSVPQPSAGQHQSLLRGDATWVAIGDTTQAYQPGTITTTSTSDVLATGMSVTPVAGTYLVLFSGSFGVSSGSGSVFASIYADGTQQASSERRLTNGGNMFTSARMPFTSQAIVTVNGSQAIQGRWRVSTATGTMLDRTITLIRIG